MARRPKKLLYEAMRKKFRVKWEFLDVRDSKIIGYVQRKLHIELPRERLYMLIALVLEGWLYPCPLELE